LNEWLLTYNDGCTFSTFKVTPDPGLIQDLMMAIIEFDNRVQWISFKVKERLVECPTLYPKQVFDSVFDVHKYKPMKPSLQDFLEALIFHSRLDHVKFVELKEITDE
jgi:archaellum component FlaD/FlaE